MLLSGVFTLLALPWIDLSAWRIFRRCVSIASILVLLAALRWVHRRPLRSLGFGPWPEGRRQLLSGLVMGCAALSALCALYLALGVARISIHEDTARVVRVVLTFIPAALLVGVIEEAIFRGYVLQQLMTASPRAAVALSSAAYAAVHLRPSLAWPGSAFEMAGLFILGGVLALATLRTKQLYLAIGLHAALAYGARVNKFFVEFTTPSLQWLVGTNRLVNGVAGWLALLGVGWMIARRWRAATEGGQGMGKARGVRMLVAVMAIGLLPQIASAGEDVYPKNYGEGVARKLGRGAANMVSAPLELIRVPTLTGRQEGGIAGATVGVAKGIWRGLLREAAGIYEVATFLIEAPDDFQPVIRPEFIYANGEWVE